jgi:putative oxygen-independent coproporphyrinogen III oxidase
MSSSSTGFGIYVHWPFCLAKCPYCDFNSHVRQGGVDEARFIAAYRREIAHMAALAPARQVTSIFFGGGTPSLMAPSTVGAILDAIAGSWDVAKNVEVSLEANPTSVEAERFRGYRAAGVNRVSLGVQALNDTDLKKLGRMHSVAEALTAVEIAAKSFERYSFDLIYARPDQEPAAWRAELEQAISRAAEHLSLYQLTIEPGTRFAAMAAKGELRPADPDASAALYELTGEMTAAAGLPAYEISNHARPGEESRHNLGYWRYRSYAGIGPGAHGRRGGQATQRHRKPENWLSALARNGHGIVEESEIGAREARVEALLMGLRLAEGVTCGPEDLEMAAVGRLSALGLLDHNGERLRVTPRGMLLLDAILAEVVKIDG